MKSLNQSRIQPINLSEMRPEWNEILNKIPGDGLKGKYAPVNVLGMLMYNPKTLGQFLDYWVNSKTAMGLSVREQELVILRMARHYDCNYVWKHHIPVAVEFGVSQDEIDAVKIIPLPRIFSQREEAILIMTDEFVNIRNISDETWNHYRGALSDSEIVDLISLVSQYVLFALTNNVLKVQIEKNLDEIQGL
jgi:alkylhydroperoxidase family enzyme